MAALFRSLDVKVRGGCGGKGMQEINVSGPFEEAMAQACAELRAIEKMAGGLVDRMEQIAGPKVPPDSLGLEAFDDACDVIIARQQLAHGMLAGQVAEVAATIDGAGTALEETEVPRRGDVWLGYVSKALMRRRMAGRPGKALHGQRLLLALGRCDRLAGIIDMHRDAVKGQRDRAEAALSRLHLRGDARDATGSDDAVMPSLRPAGVETTQLMDTVVMSFSDLVDALNTAIADRTVLLHKLTFDLEHALEIYNILTDMGLVREALPGPEAYPYFSRSIERLTQGVLPGGRLAPARQAAERAFADRFPAA
jgi:hypothetical protein